jgi:hypothetical protein
VIRVCFNFETEGRYQKLPPSLRLDIRRRQEYIELLVQKHVPGARATSGWRDPIYNASEGGKPLSLHIWGAARDYGLETRFPALIPGLYILREHDHYHVGMTE